MSSTRDRILAETRRLIAERGAVVSMGDVARAAEISRQAVYLHFPTRGQLLLELVNRMDDEALIRPRLAAALEDPDPVAALRAFTSTWLRFAATIQPVATVLVTTRATDADAWAAWEDRMGDLRRGYRRATRRLAAAGALRDGLDEAGSADLAWAMTSVPVWEQLTLDCGWSGRRIERQLVDAVVAALVER